MSRRIRYCSADGTYTLSETCPKCGGSTRPAHPPKFSPQDNYGRYRRAVRESCSDEMN